MPVAEGVEGVEEVEGVEGVEGVEPVLRHQFLRSDLHLCPTCIRVGTPTGTRQIRLVFDLPGNGLQR